MKKLIAFALLGLATFAFSESALGVRSDAGSPAHAATMQAHRQNLVFQLPESRNTVRLTLSDMQGRVVWARHIASGEARQQVLSLGASGIVPGNYAVRAVALTGSGDQALLEARFAYAP